MPGIFEFLAKKENIDHITNDFISKLFYTEPSKLNAELFFFLKDANEESIKKLNVLITLIRHNKLSLIKQNEWLKNKFNLLFELQKVGFNSIQEELQNQETGSLEEIKIDTFVNYFKNQEKQGNQEKQFEWTQKKPSKEELEKDPFLPKKKLSKEIEIIKRGILEQPKLDEKQSNKPDEFDFLKTRIIKEVKEKESFWNRYGTSILAAAFAGGTIGAAGGAIAGGVISVLSAPVTGGLSLLGAPFLAGVGAGIGFGVGFISGLLTGIARNVYDNHKTKSKSQDTQKEPDEFLADPEEGYEPEKKITDKITDKISASYVTVIEFSAKGDQEVIDSLKESKDKQPKSIHHNIKTQKDSELKKSFNCDESDSLSGGIIHKKEGDSEEDSFNRDISNSL